MDHLPPETIALLFAVSLCLFSLALLALEWWVMRRDD
jgi:nitrogen fixation-related uncharacterized protein